MSKRKPYKRYSPEFKRESLKRASEEGVTDRFICKELDIRNNRVTNNRNNRVRSCYLSFFYASLCKWRDPYE